MRECVILVKILTSGDRNLWPYIELKIGTLVTISQSTLAQTVLVQLIDWITSLSVWRILTPRRRLQSISSTITFSTTAHLRY